MIAGSLINLPALLSSQFMDKLKECIMEQTRSPKRSEGAYFFEPEQFRVWNRSGQILCGCKSRSRASTIG